MRACLLPITLCRRWATVACMFSRRPGQVSRFEIWSRAFWMWKVSFGMTRSASWCWSRVRHCGWQETSKEWSMRLKSGGHCRYNGESVTSSTVDWLFHWLIQGLPNSKRVDTFIFATPRISEKQNGCLSRKWKPSRDGHFLKSGLVVSLVDSNKLLFRKRLRKNLYRESKVVYTIIVSVENKNSFRSRFLALKGVIHGERMNYQVIGELPGFCQVFICLSCRLIRLKNGF